MLAIISKLSALEAKFGTSFSHQLRIEISRTVAKGHMAQRIFFGEKINCNTVQLVANAFQYIGLLGINIRAAEMGINASIGFNIKLFTLYLLDSQSMGVFGGSISIFKRSKFGYLIVS